MPAPRHRPLHKMADARVYEEDGDMVVEVPRFRFEPDDAGDALDSGIRGRVTAEIREVRRVTASYIGGALEACAAYEAEHGRPAPRLAEWQELAALL